MPLPFRPDLNTLLFAGWLGITDLAAALSHCTMSAAPFQAGVLELLCKQSYSASVLLVCMGLHWANAVQQTALNAYVLSILS